MMIETSLVLFHIFSLVSGWLLLVALFGGLTISILDRISEITDDNRDGAHIFSTIAGVFAASSTIYVFLKFI